MANNKAFKIKNGLLAGRYLQSNGTVTSGTEGYYLAGASYDSVSFSVTAQETEPRGIFLKPDGTKLYVCGNTGDDVNEYNLSTPYVVSTASYVQSFSVASQAVNPSSIFFKPDGTKLYFITANTDTVYQYSLSTAWNISTASYDSKSFSVATQETVPTGLYFKPDGTKMYVVGQSGDGIDEYDLSTAWDVSTSSFNSFTSTIAGGNDNPNGVEFNSDGTKLFILQNGLVCQFSLSTAWDSSTLQYDSILFDPTAQDSLANDISIASDGSKIYVLAGFSDNVYQYSTVLNTASLDLSTGTSFSFTLSGATTVSFTNPPASGLAIGFKLEVINTGGYTLTWPSSVKWHGGTAPAVTYTKELYSFITTDGGTTYYGRRAAEDIQ